MKKIPRDDPRASHMAGEASVDRGALEEFLADKHRWILATTRSDGRPQMSPVTGGVTSSGFLAVASYPGRAKARNARRNPDVSVLVLGEEFNDPWVQVDGSAEVLDMPDAGDGLVEYYRSISGEHPNWDEYRDAMAEQDKCVILIRAIRWSPVSRGGFPPSLFEEA